MLFCCTYGTSHHKDGLERQCFQKPDYFHDTSRITVLSAVRLLEQSSEAQYFLFLLDLITLTTGMVSRVCLKELCKVFGEANCYCVTDILIMAAMGNLGRKGCCRNGCVFFFFFFF